MKISTLVIGFLAFMAATIPSSALPWPVILVCRVIGGWLVGTCIVKAALYDDTKTRR